MIIVSHAESTTTAGVAHLGTILHPPLTLRFLQFFAVFGEIAVFAVILHPPLTLDEFSNFCDFSKNSEKLEKSQFLLKYNMTKNCEKSRATQKIVRLTIFCNTRKIAIFAIACISGHKCDLEDQVWAWQHIYQEIASNHISTRKVRKRENKLPWITNEIKKEQTTVTGC